MAKASFPLPIIQLFGRWGSDAVLRYVRDAALGDEGGSVAQQLSGLISPKPSVDLKMIVEESRCHQLPLADVAKGRALTEASIEQVANAILPKIMDSVVDPTGLTADLEKAVKDIRHDIDVLAGHATPPFVMNPIRGNVQRIGRLHATAGDLTTICGWPWKLAGGEARLRQELSDSEALCKTCFPSK